jgi:polyisoprenyl-teichoic acid--peptidoglycan teichoic acid transferase
LETQLPFRVLIVCTGNICRSPLAERLLQTGLDRIIPGIVETASAGTKASAGESMSPYSAEIANSYGVSPGGFSARQLNAEMLQESGLVLTMTAKHRGEVIRMDPTLLKRTFTIREFARLLNALDSRAKEGTGGAAGGETAEAFWAALPAKAASARHLTLGTPPSDNDVLDPYGLERDAYKQMESELLPAVTSVLRYVSKHAPSSTRPEQFFPVAAPAAPARNAGGRGFKGWGRGPRKNETADSAAPGAALPAAGAAGSVSAVAAAAAAAAATATAGAAGGARGADAGSSGAATAVITAPAAPVVAPAPAKTVPVKAAPANAAPVAPTAVAVPAVALSEHAIPVSKAAQPGPPHQQAPPRTPREQPSRAEESKAKKSRTARLVLGGAAMVVVVSAALAGAYVFNLAKTFDEQTTKIDSAFPDESTRPKEPAAVNGRTPLNFLVIGSDSLEESTGEAEKGMSSDQRSDTLMLVHVPADRKKVFSISLMRDLWVKIPGYGDSKINSALAHGGVPLTVQTVESILHQRIDHVVMVDVAGFNRVTDAVGGVELNVEVPFTSTIINCRVFDKGTTKMNGPEALAFVRERQAFADGDYQRVRNQQGYMQGLFNKVADPKTFLDPLKITNMVTVMSPFVSVDKGLNALEVAEIATELHEVRPSSIAMFTLPTRGVGTSADGQSIVLTDPKAIKDISDSLTADKLDEYLAKNPVQDRPQG